MGFLSIIEQEEQTSKRKNREENMVKRKSTLMIPNSSVDKSFISIFNFNVLIDKRVYWLIAM